MRVTMSVLIERPPEAVFRYVAAEFPRTRRTWANGVIEVDKLTEGPFGVGTAFRCLRKSSFKVDEDAFRVIKFEPHSRFVYGRIKDKLDLGVSFAFDPTPGGGTKLTYAFTHPSPVLFTFLEGWKRRRAYRSTQLELTRLKEILESPAARGSTVTGAAAPARS